MINATAGKAANVKALLEGFPNISGLLNLYLSRNIPHELSM
jgi:hypothetical protein